MFYPQQMTEVQLIIPAKTLLAVTKVLADQGIFHQLDSSSLSPQSGAKPAESWVKKAAAYSALERQILSVMQVLGIDEGSPQKSNDWTAMVDIDGIRPIIDQIEKQVNETSLALSSANKQLENLQSMLDQLEPLANVDLEMEELRNPNYLYSVLGIIPIANIDRLQTSLSRIPFVFLTLHHEGQKAIVWLAGRKRNSDILERAARSAYLNPLSLPENYQGTPAEIIAMLQKDADQERQSIARQKGILSQINAEHIEQLQKILWEVRASRILADAIRRFGQLRFTYLIIGWVPSSSVEALKLSLQKVTRDFIFETSSPKRGDIQKNVPVALNNPRLFRSFQTLVTNYANPRYEEVDPTLLMAITYPLLFGAMFGDAGQGLVLAALGAVMASGKIKSLRSMTSMGGIIAACGLFAAVFGVLYGSLFGFENVLPSLWIRPMDNILTTLIFAISAGVVLLSVGIIMSIINALTAGDKGKLLFDSHGLAGLLLYWSLIGIAIEAGTGKFILPVALLGLIAVVSGLAVMFSDALKNLVEGHRPLAEDGPATYVMRAFFELFETLISFLSNSISYVRVGAFAVAHVGLSTVIFILAGLLSPGHGILYWAFIVGGNLFIIGFEGLIVGIQAMRLSYYEFFNKFFNGGGTRYEPLTLQTKPED
jgi:V/A-type H+-transporting ATPase subunit I